jgi:hypothetical protein
MASNCDSIDGTIRYTKAATTTIIFNVEERFSSAVGRESAGIA